MTTRLLTVLFITLLSSPGLAAPKNILLFVADDLGREVVGCYGNPVINTTHLDALAKDGARFTSAFCTTASCTASRSVILSGVHNHRTGLYGHEHSYHHFRAFDNLRTLPIMLADAGYRTARAGKYHVAPEEVFKFQQTLPPDPARFQKFIEVDPAKPFFFYFCTNEPHRPFAHDPEDRIDPKDVIVPDWLPDTPECRDELALYYASTRRVDQAIGRLIDVLKRTNTYDDTLILFISDNGAPFPGSKTNLYEPGMRLPCILKLPKPAKPGHVNDAMITWLDITPTLLDFAGARAPAEPPAQPQRPRNRAAAPPAIQGQSFLSIIEQDEPAGWDEVHASHTFHEITMYYPMRLVRTRTHKLIWNIAHPLPFPFASDLHDSTTWQGVLERKADSFGKRAVRAYIHRPQFELYDLVNDPDELHNLAADSRHADLLADLKTRLKHFQQRTSDPWLLKWNYE